MKFFLFLAIAIVATVTGCASGGNHLVLDTVGPAPTQRPETNGREGTLIVYSAFEPTADFNARDPYRPEYSDYRLCDENGKLLRKVHNNDGSIVQDPARVTLPAGKYTVSAKANGYGRVTIPILIEPQKSTILHLEGGQSIAEHPQDQVALPDGRLVGTKASF